MKKIISFFLKLDIYNKFHSFFGAKLFKFFKIFFVDTDLKKIPNLNHPLNIDYNIELEKYKKTISNNFSPFTSYSHILDLIKVTEKFFCGCILNWFTRDIFSSLCSNPV